MLKRKKLLTALLLGFVVFFIIQSPVEAAVLVRQTVRGATTILLRAADGFATFLRSLA